MKVTITKGEGSERLNNLLEQVSVKLTGKVGWFPKNRYKDGTFVAQVAAQNEFGTDKIPARPFFRTSVSENKVKWKSVAKRLAKKLLDKDITQKQYLEQLSLVAEGDVRDKIRSIQEPALAESTIKGRLSKLKSGKRTGTLEKPLIDTAVMINSLTKIVE